MSKIVKIWKETADELMNKVTWPTWPELRSSTAIVIIASILFALVILAIDESFQVVIEKIYDLKK